MSRVVEISKSFNKLVELIPIKYYAFSDAEVSPTETRQRNTCTPFKSIPTQNETHNNQAHS
jgi:hypothetical protein